MGTLEDECIQLFTEGLASTPVLSGPHAGSSLGVLPDGIDPEMTLEQVDALTTSQILALQAAVALLARHLDEHASP